MQSSFSPFPQNLHLTALIVTFHQQWHRNAALYFLVLCPTCLLPLTFRTNDTAVKSLIKTLKISEQQTALHCLPVRSRKQSLAAGGTRTPACSAWRLVTVQVGSELPTCTRHGHRHRLTVTGGCVDTICLSWWRARCARNMWRVKNKNKNKYPVKKLCVTLVIYQESSHDARSTKCKISL
jgi:hypothetical protein